MKRIVAVREIIKWSVLGLVTFLALIHVFGNKAVWAPLDAYCPFGSLESAWKLITQGGFLEKIQPSNLALLTALFLTTILFGGVFCGWICPLGTLQDGLNWIGRKLRLPQIQVPQKWDTMLRWLRLPFLALVLFESALLVKLWFADYDPFRLIFGFHWITEPEKILISGWIIMSAFLLLSLLWRRFWCRYLCPFGLVVHGLSKISWFKIRWHKNECLECNICSKNCPLGLTVTDPKLNSTACNDCLQCVSVCPRSEAIKYQAKLTGNSGLAIAGVATFFLILITAQIIGWWNPIIGSDPASIRGWMSLGHISEIYHIPVDEMIAELNLPETADKNTEVRSLEILVPDFSTDLFRQYVAGRIGKPYVSVEQSKTVTAAEKTDLDDKVKDVINKSTSPNNSGDKTEPISGINPKQSDEAGSKPTKDPNEIKGSMSLTEVSKGWQIPLAILIETLGLPQDVNPNQPIREYDAPYGIGGEAVRNAVKEILGLKKSNNR